MALRSVPAAGLHDAASAAVAALERGRWPSRARLRLDNGRAGREPAWTRVRGPI
ncbi:hypothetical protein [Nonomuraea helvata]|uniref:Uncharacterized protein n=1 Tax=Nonomuraea helvata TaxID=37484 RepID=A0ABV5RWK0_9ACTN